jgi:MFS-type transporter involved in bile tolerance (Atg22 family)
MKLVILVGLLAGTLLLSSCGAVTGTIDFGFIKIPSILILGGLVFYIIYKRNHR